MCNRLLEWTVKALNKRSVTGFVLFPFGFPQKERWGLWAVASLWPQCFFGNILWIFSAGFLGWAVVLTRRLRRVVLNEKMWVCYTLCLTRFRGFRVPFFSRYKPPPRINTLSFCTIFPKRIWTSTCNPPPPFFTRQRRNITGDSTGPVYDSTEWPSFRVALIY